MEELEIKKLANGDHKAFEDVFILYFSRVKVFISGIIKSEVDAEELAQDVFVSLWNNREKLDYYYVQKPKTGDKYVNVDLEFAKAHHIVLSYGLGITDNIHLRVEPYYQYLYNMPVESGTSFSTINQYLFYMDRALVNDGEGQNYGVDITLEQYLNRGFYWMFTGSIFNSTYKGGDGVWRNTKYNRKFITNALVGKEWMCGKLKQNVFSVNIGLLFLKQKKKIA